MFTHARSGLVHFTNYSTRLATKALCSCSLKVVRELLVNALVHRPYTQQGDIYLNLHPDRLEMVNPGRLPLGVTPRNILHASRRRNDRLATVSVSGGAPGRVTPTRRRAPPRPAG